MKTNNLDYEKDLVDSVIKDFKTRQVERKNYENNWILDINFYIGNQYCSIDDYGQINDFAKQYFWQEHEVFNHIAPLVDVRLSKLNRVRPTMTVVPFSDSEKDIYKADVSRKILEVVSKKKDLSSLIAKATMWSELTGTVFYKVIWDSKSGNVIGNVDGQSVHTGDVNISVISPFEIFPDSNTYEDISSCKSIIHARSYHVDEVFEKWNVKLDGSDIDVFTLENISSLGGLGYTASAKKTAITTKSNQVLVIEKYVAPSKEYPNGRLIIVAGDKLVYDDELPFVNTITGEREFPFVRQICLATPNSFWGTSIIDRCIPIQRAYNAVKNRKHEYINRMSMGVLTVEDGSIDTDNLEEEGMSPGKVLIYRQGSNPPKMLGVDSVPLDFSREETLLENEMLSVSGVSDLLKSVSNYSNLSGVALELLVEQDETRLVVSADEIRKSIKEISQFVLALYKNYGIAQQTAKLFDGDGKVQMFYWNSSQISYDDIIFETENEINQTLAQKRSYIFDLVASGLLNEKDGTLSPSIKSKVLDSLGYGVWDTTQDIDSLHDARADGENMSIKDGKDVAVSEVDNHDRHIARHTAYLVSNNIDSISNNDIYQRMIAHIHEHKKIQNMTNLSNSIAMQTTNLS